MSASPKPDNLPWPPLPDEKAGVLAIDIPWHFRSRAPSTNPHVNRNPQRHYPTADLEHCKTIPVKDLCLPDAHIMLWITGPLLVAGAHLTLFKAWGVRPSSMGFVWIKVKPTIDISMYRKSPLLQEDLIYGTGFTTMQNAEYCIFGRLGSPQRGRKDIRQIIIEDEVIRNEVMPVGGQVIVSARREHSRKPDEFYRRARHYAYGPYIDAFGGEERKGWTYWGYPHRDGVGPQGAGE